ncbi:MAG: roadblock/LC7 domain-containing protein [Candidatus Jordarchaeum sp.]|uniref:roadblock/LC7 domain-containing protein n=1 Tax=Candidatus Jordarchaeum sp. TaxID=2823881 RepID=UPI00404A1301
MPKNWRGELEGLLKAMEDADPDIEASAIVRTDGLVMASALPKNADEGLIAAMSAALLNIGNRAVVELARGEMDKVIVSGTKGDIILRGVGSEAVLSAITKPGANLGLLLVEMKRAGDRVVDVLKQM